jgi:UDP-N-acetylglucosamine 2-epimerase (non-hydrolysing)
LIVQALRQLAAVSAELPVVFPVHPRTRAEIESWGIDARSSPGLQLLDPIRYLEFISLIAGAAGVLTDSGGLQEETTYLGVPCFTLRDNTERPVTIDVGTNQLLGLCPERIADVPHLIGAARQRAAGIPPLWDGRAAERIVDVLATPGPRQPAAGA